VGRLVFAHPAYLWGLLALSLPILVHLFNRRRPRPLAFGAIEFVLRSQQRRVRRLRLRQILLLALRCLLIAGWRWRFRGRRSSRAARRRPSRGVRRPPRW